MAVNFDAKRHEGNFYCVFDADLYMGLILWNQTQNHSLENTQSLDIRLILTITVALVCNSINLGATFSQCHGSFQSYFWVIALFFP